MTFLRVVEVLPPRFPNSGEHGGPFDVDAEIERFIQDVRSMRGSADVFLIANAKDPRSLKLDAVHTATMLREVLGVTAAPVVVVRDHNRPSFLSSVLTAVSVELQWMMFAWGDDYLGPDNPTNVRDFAGLADAIRGADTIRSRARSPTRFFAPVDVEGLASSKGSALASGRLKAGADLLLAQPPTTDAEGTFDRHISLVEKAGLREKVLLNVFPFRDETDVERYEKMFGWNLPPDLHEAAAEGEGRLLELCRAVVRRLRSEGHPGVYLTTRGVPGFAEKILG